jgi:Ca-activated chloride channel homolog
MRDQSFPGLPGKLRFAFAAGLTLLLWLCQQSWSLPPRQPSSTPPPSKTDSRSSTLLITVRTKDGASVGLSTADLQIKVDGKTALIQQIRHVTGLPLDYAILIDNSGSERIHLEAHKVEVTEFLSKVVQPGRDHGMLVNFNDQAYVDADSANPQDLVNALAKSSARGGTALYDAVVACADGISKNEDARNDEEKDSSYAPLRLMFILSDGEDNSSHVTLDAAIQAALRAGIRIYAIGESPDPNRAHNTARATSTLKEFAQRTGGKVYLTGKDQDTTKIAADIADELTNLFAVSYTAPQQKSDGQLHKLELKSNKKGVSITAPDRYFAPTTE